MFSWDRERAPWEQMGECENNFSKKQKLTEKLIELIKEIYK